MTAYSYHDSPRRPQREIDGTCRCGSTSENIFEISGFLAAEPHITSPAVPTDRDGIPLIGKYIYAVSVDYEMRIALDGDRLENSSVKHETLFHNQDVLAAGEIGFTSGEVSSINDHSGSYGTDGEMKIDPEYSSTLLKAFGLKSIPLESSLQNKIEMWREGII